MDPYTVLNSRKKFQVRILKPFSLIETHLRNKYESLSLLWGFVMRFLTIF